MTREVKKTNKVISKQAEKYLGEITSILDGRVELVNKHSQSKDSYYIYDVYFDFNKEDMNLYFEWTHSLNWSKDGKIWTHVYKVPLNQLSPEKIWIDVGPRNASDNTQVGLITIEAKFNEDSIDLKYSYLNDNDKWEINPCDSMDRFDFYLHKNNAIALHKALINFSKSFEIEQY